MIKRVAIYSTFLFSLFYFHTLAQSKKDSLAKLELAKKNSVKNPLLPIGSNPTLESSSQDSTLKEEPIIKEYEVEEDENSKPGWFMISSGIVAVILGLVIRRRLKKKKNP